MTSITLGRELEAKGYVRIKDQSYSGDGGPLGNIIVYTKVNQAQSKPEDIILSTVTIDSKSRIVSFLRYTSTGILKVKEVWLSDLCTADGKLCTVSTVKQFNNIELD